MDTTILEDLGICDSCGEYYDLTERNVTGSLFIRCGDCGNCSDCCPPHHTRDNLIPIEKECGS